MANPQNIELSKSALAQHVCDYFQQRPNLGYILEPNKCQTEVHALFFQDCPYKNCTTVITNGLHNLPNDIAPNNRQELLFMYENGSSLSNEDVIFVLEAFIDIYFFRLGNYLPCHKFIDVETPIFPKDNLDFNGFYLSHPCYFPEEFDGVSDGDITINLIYLAPIFQTEMDYLKENSPSDFEDRLVEMEECLCDMNRRSTV
jgi:Suppressor of fused protein (SUFU)